MNLMKIKWENIFGIIMFIALGTMTIKWVIENGFDMNVIMFDLVYISMAVITVMWCVKQTRRFYLSK